MKKITISLIFINCKNKNNERPYIGQDTPILTDENNSEIENKKIIKKKINKFEDIADIFYKTGEYLSKKDNNCDKSFNEQIKKYIYIRNLYVYDNIKQKGFYALNLNQESLSKDGSISFTDFIKENTDKNFIFLFKNSHPTDKLKEDSKKFFEKFKSYKNCYWNSSFFSDLDILEKKKEGYIHQEIYTFEKMEDIEPFIYKIFNLKKEDLVNFISSDKNFKESIFTVENFLNELKKKKIIFQISYDKNKKYDPFEKRPIQEIIEASPIYQEYKEMFEITYT
jgi:hypothetical protein